jgi:mxaD protein
MKSAALRAVPLLLLVLPLVAWSHGPTPRRVTEAIDIKAAPDKVWALAGDFAGMNKWNPLVIACSADKGNAVDSQRHVVLKNGAELVDSMDWYDTAQMSYTYRLMNVPGEGLPVSFYSATLAVTPGPGGSHVTWTGNFYRADTHNEPAEGQDDESAEKAMHEFLAAGLQGLKQTAEK